MAKKKVTVEVCDNPNCPSEPQITEPSERAEGFYLGKGFWIHEASGRPIPATFACSWDCLMPAIESNIEKERS